jgi:hypothetical protein
MLDLVQGMSDLRRLLNRRVVPSAEGTARSSRETWRASRSERPRLPSFRKRSKQH